MIFVLYYYMGLARSINMRGERNMKIGIITIMDNTNYGNRLQNYALQVFLKSLGHDVVTLRNENFTELKYRRFVSVKDKIRQILQVTTSHSFITRIKRKLVHRKSYEEQIESNLIVKKEAISFVSFQNFLLLSLMSDK